MTSKLLLSFLLLFVSPSWAALAPPVPGGGQPLPLATGLLPVGEEHALYWERYGNPEGVPVVFIHGGPGGDGFDRNILGLFDLSHHHVLLFDQRGAGLSQPAGATRANTPAHLLADLERLRAQVMRAPNWVVVGHSWGGALATLYAAAHSGRVRSAVLIAPFLARPEDVAHAEGNLSARFGRVSPREALFDHYLANHFFLEPGAVLRAAAVAGERAIPAIVLRGKADPRSSRRAVLALWWAWKGSRLVEPFGWHDPTKSLNLGLAARRAIAAIIQ